MTVFNTDLSPKSHVLNSSIFKRFLNIDHLSAAQVLKKLQHLTGCVYLEDHGNPLISVLPLNFTTIQNNQIQFFGRKSTTAYEQTSSYQNLHDFVTFRDSLDPLNKHGSAGFTGGYIGFLDYNYAAQQHIRSPQMPQPQLFIGRYESYLRFEDGQWIFYSLEEDAEQIFKVILDSLKQEENIDFILKQQCIAAWEKADYQHAFDRVQAYIQAGDCYQINLTQAFTAKVQGQLLATAEQFWQLTHAPYAGYLKLGTFELLSCSPELFIDFKAHRKIVTKPIKGTMPRYADPQLDESSKQTLKHSEKDQAENVMIVDLLRNDLSVFAETGSVKTPKLFEIESFNQVHHMVSEVEAILKSETHPLDVLLHSLPGGSITGAPKIRAMQIIEELEIAPRGAYCGSMGYFNFDGTGSWNILIRTIQKYQDELSIWAGGGVTIASNADAEYQECFDKVSAMLNLINTWYKPQ